MRYQVLGPLEVSRDGADIDLGSPKQRAVLAALAIEAGRVVPTERLVDEVWGDAAPANVVASLQVYVSNLRRLLRDETTTSPIVRQAPGYRLDADAVDAREFLSLADAARAATEQHDWPAAVDAAQAALALWRGEVLADLRDEEWVRLAAVPLDERRATCLEELVTALLGAGRSAAALDVARRLYDAQPLRERACWLYVLALHREGRTIEALDAHRAMAHRLDQELGLDPGPAVRDPQGAILRHDAELLSWPNAAAVGAPDTATPNAAGPDTATPDTARPDTARPDTAMHDTARHDKARPDTATHDTATHDTAGLNVARLKEPPEEPSEDPPAAAGPTLVGRETELAVIDAALADVAAGAVRWIVLSGPAGIGKTRLAEEAMGRAARRGFRLLRAVCPDDEGIPPWWPVAQMLPALSADPVAVLAQDPGAEADRARYAVYERVRGLLAAAADGGPLAVLVDDVQWADPNTLGLLSYLTFTLDATPVVMLLAARAGVTGADLSRLFDSVARRAGTHRINVPPLAATEVNELVHQVSGEQVSRQEAALLLTRTGNPFFVSEYARLPRAEREAGEIPLAVRAVLDRRLDALDAGTLQVLRTAAVIGDVLDIGLLRTVTRLDVDELADLLDEAADEQIVVVAPSTRSYTFAHGLLRDTLLAGMSAARRQRLHARVADAVAADDLPRRAGHLLAALPLVDPEEVFEACRAAAEDADAQWHADAAGRGQTVYAVVDEDVSAAIRAGRFASVAVFCRVLMRSTGAWPWAAFGSDPSPLLMTLRSAEPLLTADPASHAVVLAALAVGSCYHPDGTVPDRLSQQAIDIAEALGDPDVLADALLGRALTFSGIAERVHESKALLDRLAALQHTTERLDEVIRHGLMTMVCLTLGDPGAAAEHSRLGTAGSDALRLSISRLQFRLTDSVVALWAGRFDEAETLFADGLRLREQVEVYVGWQRAAVVVSRWTRGRPALSSGEPGDAPDPIVDIAVSGSAGDTERADDLIGAWLDAEGPVMWTSAGSWTLLAHLVADAGLTRHAPRLIGRLDPLAGLVATIGQMTVVGPISLALARLRLLLGERGAARRDGAAALDLAIRAGGGPSVLRARTFLADLDGAG